MCRFEKFSSSFSWHKRFSPEFFLPFFAANITRHRALYHLIETHFLLGEIDLNESDIPLWRALLCANNSWAMIEAITSLVLPIKNTQHNKRTDRQLLLFVDAVTRRDKIKNSIITKYDFLYHAMTGHKYGDRRPCGDFFFFRYRQKMRRNFHSWRNFTRYTKFYLSFWCESNWNCAAVPTQEKKDGRRKIYMSVAILAQYHWESSNDSWATSTFTLVAVACTLTH